MSLSLIRQADYKPTKDKLIRLKQSLDDGIFASTGKSGMELERLKNSLYDADVKYSQMKRIEDDSLYEGIQKGTTKELTQAKLDKKFRNTNDKLNEYLSGLDAPSRERLEIEAIKNTLERNIKETMGGKRVVDYSGMLKTLKDNPNYKSEAAKKAIEITEKMNKIHGLDHTLADAFKAPKDPKLQQGLSHNVAVRYLTMAANRAVQNTVKFLPFLQMGKTAASRHAIYNAVMSSSSVQELGEKLSKAAMNKDIPISEKIDIIEMAKAQFKFSNELDKAKADGIVKETAEQGSKLEQAEAKQEAVKGEGWTMRDGGEANLEIYEGNGVIDFSSKIDDDFLRANATKLEPSSNLFDFLAKTKNNPSRDKILNHFADKAGERDSKALNHRMAYLNYIMPTIEEPLIKIFRPDGRISNIKPFVFTDVNSKTKNVNFLSIVTDKDGNIDFITAYALKDKSQLRSEIKKGIKVEVRRGLTRTFDPHSRVQVPSATDEIISQKGNLVNKKEIEKLVSRQTAGTSTLPTPLSAADKTALKQDANSAGEAYSSATDGIISQNPADRLVEKIIELDDAEKIGNMLQKTIISKDISTKTKIAAINAAKRRLVAITAKNAQKDDKKQK